MRPKVKATLCVYPRMHTGMCASLVIPSILFHSNLRVRMHALAFTADWLKLTEIILILFCLIALQTRPGLKKK